MISNKMAIYEIENLYKRFKKTKLKQNKKIVGLRII